MKSVRTRFIQLSMPRPKRTRAVSAFTVGFNKTLRERGLTLKQAANIMQIAYSTVVGYSNGAMPTDMEAISRFCATLSLDFEYLLTGKMRNIEPSLIALEHLFEEEGTSFSGIYKIEAKKLLSKGKP